MPAPKQPGGESDEQGSLYSPALHDWVRSRAGDHKLRTKTRRVNFSGLIIAG